MNQNDSVVSEEEARMSLCNEIEDALQAPVYSVVFHVHLILLAGTLGAIGLLVRQQWRHRIQMHGNLLILLANIVLVNFLYILAQFAWLLRYRVSEFKMIIFFYTSPCELLTPLWMVFFFYGPSYIYSVACPLLHFFVMLERVRATVLAEKYENEGQRLGICMAAVTWLFSLLYFTFVLIASLLDTAIPREQGVIYMDISAYISVPILCTNIVLLALILLTVACDCRLSLVNRRLRKDSSQQTANYSLSRNYQLHENQLAIQLILPIDISYALLFTIFNSLVILIRTQRSALGMADYRFYYNLINTLLFLYIALTTIIYIRFINFVKISQERNVITNAPKVEHGQMYMKQLQQQWVQGIDTQQTQRI